MSFGVFCALKKLVRDRVGGGVVDIVKNFEKHCAPSAPEPIEGNRKGREDLRKVRKGFFYLFPFLYLLEFTFFHNGTFPRERVEWHPFLRYGISTICMQKR